MINFKNKKILVTGASGGIGSEIVKKFVSLGGEVLGTGTKAEKLDFIKKQYQNIKVKKFDISEHSRIEEFIDNWNQSDELDPEESIGFRGIDWLQRDIKLS